MKYFRLIIAISLLLVPLLSHGKIPTFSATVTNPIDIAALHLEYDKEKSTYIATGSVEMREGLRILKADNVTYNEETKDVTATGNVVFQDAEDVVQCDTLRINLITKKGTLENGRIFIKVGNFYVSGQHIEKTGENTYVIEKGELTTCGFDKPAWKFTAKNVEVTVEGYAKTKGANFFISGHKAFYLPHGMFPVKTERQSGFLIPQLLKSSRDGWVPRFAYYYALSQDKDATFYLDYIENRGPKFGAEFRYALKEDLKGAWFGSIIDDTDYGHTRYQIRGFHEQLLAYDVTLKSTINYVSDNLYLKDFAYLRDFAESKDFAQLFPDRGTSYMEKTESLLKSNAYLEKPFNKSLLTIEGAYNQNLTRKDNDYTWQYLPFMTFFTEYVPFMQDKLYGNFNSNFVNYTRATDYTFSRMRLEPTVRLPYSFNGLNLTGSASFLENMYISQGSSDYDSGIQNREIFKLAGDINTQLMRVYHTDFLKFGELQSIIKPQAKYTYISNSAFSGLPPLDPMDPYNLGDRIYQTNALSYALNHYLNTQTLDGGTRELSILEIGQSYGLGENLNPSPLYRGYGNRLSDVNMRFTLFLKENLAFTNENAFNTEGEGLSYMRNFFNYSEPGRYRFIVSHNYVKSLSNQIFFDAGATYRDFDLRYFIQYSFKDTYTVETRYQLVYHPKCWSVAMALIQTSAPSDTTFRISFDLVGLTTGVF